MADQIRIDHSNGPQRLDDVRMSSVKQAASTTSTDGKIKLRQVPNRPPPPVPSRNMSSNFQNLRKIAADIGEGHASKLKALNESFNEISTTYKEVKKQAPSKEKWLSFFSKVVNFITFGHASLGRELSESAEKLHAQMDRFEGTVTQLQKSIEQPNLSPLEAKKLQDKAEILFNELNGLNIALKDGLRAIHRYEKSMPAEVRSTIDAVEVLGNEPETALETYDIPTRLEAIEKQLANPTLSSDIRSELLFQKTVLERENAIYSSENMNDLISLFNTAIALAKDDGNRLGIEPFPSISGNKTISPKDFIKQAKTMQAQTEAAFKNAGIKFQGYYNQALNASEKSWSTHSSKVSLLNPKGESMVFSCDLKPAKTLGCFSHLEGKTLGISSACRDSDHAINLWETEVKYGEETLFKALRHGNTRGKQKATDEIILAAAVQKYGGLDNLKAFASSRDNPIELPLSNVQLLSPSSLPFGFDGKLPFQQIKTLESLPQPVKLKIPGSDQPIYIKTSPLTFNFGCNLQHFNPVARRALSSSEKANLKSMERLFGSGLKGQTMDPNSPIGRYLQRDDVSANDKEMVRQLSSQVKEMWQTGAYKTNATNPYAMSSRMSLLVYKLGYTTTFNCKSGKDRTGIANSEIINLATAFKMTGAIPEPYGKLSDSDRTNLGRLLERTGANHVTKACTGVGGLKIVSALGFKGVVERFGQVTGASSSITIK